MTEIDVLKVENLVKQYDRQTVVNQLSFRLRRGQIGCLLGPSGCGKTTTLRIIAGFEEVSGGTVSINGSMVTTSSFITPPQKRNIGMVFQDYALLPHMTVQQNIGFALKDYPRKEKAKKVDEMLDIFHISNEANKYPHELSGGQQQRVALARALVKKPEIVLMDEPFSNLDVNLRETVSREVRDILKSYGATVLIVTHNQNEAFAMADIIGVMKDGSMEQWADAHTLYHRPTTMFVADFIGEGVLLRGEVKSDTSVKTSMGVLEGDFQFKSSEGSTVDILIRPDDLVFDESSSLKPVIIKKLFRGAESLYTIQLETGEKAMALLPSMHDYNVGERLPLRLDLEDIVLFNVEKNLITGCSGRILCH